MSIKIEGHKIFFTLKMWDPEMLELAKALQFEFDGEHTVSTSAYRASRRSVMEFIKYSHPWLHKKDDDNLEAKAALFPPLRKLYQNIHKRFIDEVLCKFAMPEGKQFKVHQADGLRTMYSNKYNLLSFEQGLGKTLTSYALSKLKNLKCTIIICPAVVKWNWYREIINVWGEDALNVAMLDSNRKRNRSAWQNKFVILNYDILDKYIDYIISLNPDHIILDECHYVKNEETQRYKRIEKVLNATRENLQHFTLMSGTPVKNRVVDMFPYLKLTGHPMGESRAAFTRRFVKMKKGRVGAGKNLDKLSSYLANFMIRRTAAECLDIPDKNKQKIYFELDDFKEEYNEEVRRILALGEGKSLDASIHTLNKIIATSKVKPASKFVDDLIEKDRKVIIFCTYKEPMERLAEHYGKKCVYIHGGVPAEKRDALIEKFLHDDSCMVFIGQMQAAGVGINLVNSYDVLFMNFPFVPADLDQAIARAYREGQKNKVNVYLTVCQDTIDEKLHEIIVEKARDINTLIDQGKEVSDYVNVSKELYKDLIKTFGTVVV